MIGLTLIYTVAGVLFALYAALGLLDRRWANAVFWGLLALSFLAGDRLGDLANGWLVLGLVAVAASGRMRVPAGRSIDRRRRRATAIACSCRCWSFPRSR